MQPVIYNVTTAVEPSVEKAWLLWMKEIHIPEVLATGCFSRHQMVVLLNPDESNHSTYAVQYYADSKDFYDRYLHEFAPLLRKKVRDKWGESALSFQTLMMVIS